MSNLKSNLHKVYHRPSIVKEIMLAKLYSARYEKETLEYITALKQTSPYHINPNDKQKLNTLCHLEDWKNEEIKHAMSELKLKNMDLKIIKRKDWEWALGIVALRRYGKLNKNSTGIGIGVGKERILFYLANNLNHVYATDLYPEHWQEDAPSDFPENPAKYAPFPYKEDALTVLRMDGTKLDFDSEYFDLAFSFSSIEHFGGENHSGALRSLREIERVLKYGGIAVITTEYIINDKEHIEWYNRRTIYSDLIDKLEKLQLVEPLDLRITTNTLDTVQEYYSIYLKWKFQNDQFKKAHPSILVRTRNILSVPIMLVFQKQ
jgi:SAM-dependent methyltransferase